MPDRFRAWSDVRGWNAFMGARKVWLMVFTKCEKDALLTLVSSSVDGGLWRCRRSYLWLTGFMPHRYLADFHHCLGSETLS